MVLNALVNRRGMKAPNSGDDQRSTMKRRKERASVRGGNERYIILMGPCQDFVAKTGLRC
jgi:hypothetical protein